MIHGASQDFSVRLARSTSDLHAAQRLRYDVFVKELGGSGTMVDHAAGLERDRYDSFVDHLLLTDNRTGDVIGVYRLMRSDMADRAGGFYTEGEYDIGPLKATGRRLLELGRSCLHRDYRGGIAMHRLWAGLAAYVAEHDIELLFGVASFHGTDSAALAQPLSLLHHVYLAPPELRVRARAEGRQPMDLIPTEGLDRRGAMLQIPSLMKAYLRLGGCVGDGAFIDRAFNTTDVCLVLDTKKLSERQLRIYGGQPG
ncbi:MULTISPECIES: GNAT family N-acetyltransferase [unclassified Sulfitobacter]|uniref:GNAT family N-acetyltransferase n=1 Tax=unclassified Sulfitobacter TaxID=196795 RepID=UPI0007C279F7|nr:MULTISPECIES: GNAT family N-acyltransferase [unclassified Sulfitobacter]KZX97026.1 ornithine-acyl-ACP acyltransferase [Sulfitobacter sp. HI0023]KZY24284.1 ornithine-acyl-ACP acyltransferase [Sulfitobacter sp. HI0040]KZZ69575.1 ornithine-acyl-ACP acyltransferase [Sulfitobacter sp. HI0129]